MYPIKTPLMDLHILSLAVAILKSISLAAWAGAIIFLLIVLVPVVRQFQGETRVTANASIYRKSRLYIRGWGILAIIMGIAEFFFPFTSPLAILERFSPLNVFTIQLLIIVAYVVVGEGMLLPTMGMYSSIYTSLEQKIKNQSIAHFVVLEKNVVNLLVLQLSFIVLVFVVSTYFPFSYSIP